MKPSSARLIAAAALLLAATVPALAATGPRPSGFAVMRVCKTDMKTFCPHMGMGSAAQKKCMKTNFDKLSQPCRDIIDRYQGRSGN